jgi:hypothetical protein
MDAKNLTIGYPLAFIREYPNDSIRQPGVLLKGVAVSLSGCRPYKHVEVNYLRKYLLVDGAWKPMRFIIMIATEDGRSLAQRSFASVGKEAQNWLCRKICESVGKSRQRHFVRMMYEFMPMIDDLSF